MSDILVFGKTGQVATELGLLDGTVCVGRDVADLSDPAACAALIAEHKPKAVINAAAYTAVDRAEEEEALATTVNGEAPAAMAQACAALDIPFVHISTDYVLDGLGALPHEPDATPAPLNAYGRSKLVGETAIKQAGGRYCVLRTSWVFSAHRANFLKTMLRLAESRDALTVVGDQIGGPTSAREIALACIAAASGLGGSDGREKSGIYHFSGAPDVSWADFAREIFSQAGLAVVVTDIPTADYPTPAARPLNSRMNCASLEQAFGVGRPDWRQDVAEILEQLGT